MQTSCILSAPVVCRLSDEATENIFLSLKNAKSVADCGKFWSRSLARFMRAAQFASVSFHARPLLKHFRRKFLQIIRNTDDWWIPVSRDISRTVLWVCSLSSWLKTKSVTVSTFLANVNFRYMLSSVRLSSVCLSSVVCNVRAPYSGCSNFRPYFYSIRYLGHPLTSTENFTEIVPGEPLHKGS